MCLAGPPAGRAHQLIRTSMTPSAVLASREKVSSDKSMIRPATAGPRSSTVQVVERASERSVTVTTVPKARPGLAQVPAAAQYHEASPVSSFAGGRGGGAGGTVVVVVVVVVGGGEATAAGVGGTYFAATAGTGMGSVVEVVVESSTRGT